MAYITSSDGERTGTELTEYITDGRKFRKTGQVTRVRYVEPGNVFRFVVMPP